MRTPRNQGRVFCISHVHGWPNRCRSSDKNCDLKLHEDQHPAVVLFSQFDKDGDGVLV